MRKLFKFLLTAVFVCIFLSGIALATIIVWAANGPRDLTKYSSYIEESINGVLEGKTVQIGPSSLNWGGWDKFLFIKVDDVKVADEGGNLIASLPKVRFSYDIYSLFNGSFLPSTLTLVGPEVDLSEQLDKSDSKGFDIEDFDLSKLHKISIIAGKLKLLKGEQVWKISSADAVAKRGKFDVTANLRPSELEKIKLSFMSDISSKQYTVNAELENFTTEHLKEYFPELQNISLTLNGNVSFSGEGQDLPERVEFNFPSFNGSFFDEEHLRDSLILKFGQSTGVLNPKTRGIDITSLLAEFDDGVKFSGKVYTPNLKALKADLVVADMKPQNIYKYWPRNVGDNAIGWMQKHITKDGIISKGVAKLNITQEQMESGDIPKDALDFNFRYTDMGLKYHDKFLPISKINGAAKMNIEELILSIDDAVMGGSKLSNTKIRIYDIGKEQEKIDIDGVVTGAASDLADFYIKVGKAKGVIENNNDISGQAQSAVKVKFPLISSLNLADIDVELDSKIRGASINNLFGKVKASSADVDVVIKTGGFGVKGKAVIDNLDTGGAVKATSFPTTFDIASSGQQLLITAGADLTKADIDAKDFGLKKPTGTPAKFVIQTVQTNGNPSIKRLELDSKDISIIATGALNSDYSDFTELNFSSLKFGKNDLTGRIFKAPYLTAELTGNIDLHPIITAEDDGKDEKTEFRFKGMFKRMYMTDKLKYNDAMLDVYCSKIRCESLKMKADTVDVDIGPTKAKIVSTNAGKLLRCFDIYENMRKGDLKIDANVSNGVYTGELRVDNFSIIKAKTLAKMLSLGSLTGIADALGGKGIGFVKLRSKFQLSDTKLDVKEFRMVGSAIGITSKGEIDREKDIADLSGNIIPAYTANTLLGKIPLLGDVLIGDDGVFALAYKMSGNTEDPDVAVNPLSVLAPGFLKKVFE